MARISARVGRKSLRGIYDRDISGPTRDVRASMAQVIANYQELIDSLEEITPDILFDALQPTFEKSQEYCPVDTGRLRDSGYLEITNFRGTPTVEMGYGLGGEPPYAVTVHENLEWRHKYPTRAKWLEVALTEDDTAIQQRIIAGYREVFD